MTNPTKCIHCLLEENGISDKGYVCTCKEEGFEYREQSKPNWCMLAVSVVTIAFWSSIALYVYWS